MDVIGFGALNLDRLYMVERIAREGEHVPVKGVCESPGGSAANTITGLARLGLSTGFVGALGRDQEGKILLEDFRKNNVDTSGISLLSGRTGIIIGFVDRKGERTLYPCPGVNSMLSEKDIDEGYAANASFMHITSFVSDKQFILQKRIVKKLPDVRISFSPGDLYVKKGARRLSPLIKRSSVVFLNEAEAEELTGKDFREGASRLLDRGAGIAAVTLGARGCFVSGPEGSYDIPAYKVNVVDTTGAGDAFAAGFLYTLIKGCSLLEAGRNGNMVASLCIRKVGARTGLPYRSSLKKFI